MKILFVLPRFPYPLTKGDRLRAYHQLRLLSQSNQVYLFAVVHQKVEADAIDKVAPYCQDIHIERINPLTCRFNIVRNWFASKSLQMGFWNTKRAKRSLKAYARRVNPDVVFNQMVRTMPLVARLPYPKVMDFQDALSMNTERRMEQAKGFWHYVLHFEFKMLRSSEYNAFKIFDALTIISEADSDAIPHKRNGDIKIVPNGVDFDYFDRNNKEIAEMAPADILFCGNMSYDPNVRAANYLVRRVRPIVWQQRPQTTLTLAGESPKRSVQHLGTDSRVNVTGHLDDIRTAYSSSRLFVAPMLTGSGLQNKLLEAMAMQLPCVTTTLANNALMAADGREIVVADTPQAMAQAILGMLDNPDKAAALASAGNAFVRDNYSWEAAVDKLQQVLHNVAGK